VGLARAVSDYSVLKARLLTTISGVIDEYRDEFVRQANAIKKSTALDFCE